jgi:hypothetical protein
VPPSGSISVYTRIGIWLAAGCQNVCRKVVLAATTTTSKFLQNNQMANLCSDSDEILQCLPNYFWTIRNSLTLLSMKVLGKITFFFTIFDGFLKNGLAFGGAFAIKRIGRRYFTIL